MFRTHWFWEWFMKRSYRKSQSNLTYYVKQEEFDGFPEFLERARELAKIALYNYVVDRLFGAVNRIDSPKLALKKLHKFEELYGYKINVNQPYDCDDFASALLQLGKDYDGFLVTYFNSTITQSHTIPVFKQYGEFWAVDWQNTFGVKSLDELFEKLEQYRAIKITSVHFAKFDYNKGMYISLRKEDLEYDWNKMV